ncbi:MAG TPA: MerR family transcriptional regulator [Solirubrobacterales bacterium]|nr:MerR family transcriptional regulator [Solirubrobacterales bacterium]
MTDPEILPPPGGPAADDRELTVEQLAYETGMSVRNIRNHQSRGLLPPPEVRARIGYYGRLHVERLRLIQEMQAEGLKLSAIKRLIGEYGANAERFADLRAALKAPLPAEAPEVLTQAELTERFGVDEPKLTAKAEKLGLLVAVGEGRFEAPSPVLLRAAEEVQAMGIPLAAAVEVMGKLKRNSRSSARAFVELFLDELWGPFDDAGRPAERWAEITESVERLRPLGVEALVALFRLDLSAEIEHAFGEVLERSR